MTKLELRTFSSANEDRVPKCDLMCRLSIGGTMVTRRMIDGDVCCSRCNYQLRAHGSKEVDWTHQFAPYKWRVGLRFMIERKKGEGGLCECGHSLRAHSFVAGCDARMCKCDCFKPAIFEVIGGMWHSEWVKSVMEPTTSGIMIFGQEEMKKEAKLEGFSSWQGVLDYFAKNKMDITKSWRVEMKRVG